jgi:hypothetical protein
MNRMPDERIKEFGRNDENGYRIMFPFIPLPIPILFILSKEIQKNKKRRRSAAALALITCC